MRFKVKYKKKLVGWKILTPSAWKVGMKVKRGPDWGWEDQDCDPTTGEPMLGIIAHIEGGPDNGDMDLTVVWGNQHRNSYWGGKDGQYDLYGLY